MVLGIGCLQISLWFLDQNFAMYIDDVALAMVVGGTVAVGVIAAPWHLLKQMIESMAQVVKLKKSPPPQVVIKECLDFCQTKSAPREGETSHTIAGQVLADGEELISLNFSPDDVEVVLEERLHQYLDKRKSVADFFHSLSKYPPAFGLVGTVFGLINLMRAMADGMDPAQTGVKMALALVATLYGLLMANFIVAPMGESISKGIEVERYNGEIALQAVLLAAENTSLLKSQELLNSFADRENRVDVITGMVDEMAA
jgi:chemotaxis protein MotA